MNEDYFYSTDEVIEIMYALEGLKIIHKNKSRFRSKRILKTKILSHLLKLKVVSKKK